jgi:hypothetical protein
MAAPSAAAEEAAFDVVDIAARDAGPRPCSLMAPLALREGTPFAHAMAEAKEAGSRPYVQAAPSEAGEKAPIPFDLKGFVGEVGLTAAADFNFGQTDIGFDNPFRALIGTVRGGWNGALLGAPLRLWVGGSYWRTKGAAKGDRGGAGPGFGDLLGCSRAAPSDFGQGFLPHTEDWAVIVFYRSPACIPDDFNLLDFFDFIPAFPGGPPRAFLCDLHIEGFTLWRSLDDPFPAEIMLHGTGAVPVWFVRWPELQGRSATIT